MVVSCRQESKEKMFPSQSTSIQNHALVGASSIWLDGWWVDKKHFSVGYQF
jgi:hypothetical protein